MAMKGADVYLMNVGDSRTALARKTQNNGRPMKDSNEILYGDEFENVHNLSSCQLTMDHSTSVKEESSSERVFRTEMKIYML
ncbi:probable phosphatase 2C 4 [Olea europaea subsp. europaea]|nr:probable phosphatase 2C 4 [Olea europaea subsp. europaea]